MAGAHLGRDGARRARPHLALIAVSLLGLYAATRAATGTAPSALVHASLLASCGLALARALRSRERRAGWVLLASGLLCSESGALLEPVLSGAVATAFLDLLYVGTYTCLAASLVVLLQGKVGRIDAATVLDGVVCGLGTGMVLAATLLAGAPGTHLDPLYPLLDLVLITVLAVVLAVTGWRLTPGLGLALLALGLCAVADGASAAQQGGAHTPASWTHGLWVLGFLSAALGSGRRLVTATPRRQVPHLAQLLMPVFWILVCGALRGVDRLHRFPLSVLVLTTLTSFLAVWRLVLSVRDVQALAASRLEARTDPLTGLPNRRALYEQLEEDLAEGTCTVLILALDGFKEINDSLGHHHGDALLAEIGPRLTPLLREHDLLARLGGDEFAVVLPGLGGLAAYDVAQRLLGALSLPFELDDVRVHVGGSIGVACSPQHGRDVHSLMRKADIAMYQAKELRGAAALYGASAAHPSRERLQTVNELRDALTDGSLVLHYQPKLELATGRVKGLEALLRWRDPHGVLRLPDSFLPLAQQAGLMGPLSDHVLDLALDQLVTWTAEGLTGLNVAVNLPPSAVVDASLPARVECALGERGLPGSALTLEITEQSLLDDRESASQVLHALRVLGVTISIDDFGTGYSSLAYLRDLPVDELKLDRAFVGPLVGDKRAAALVRSTIDLTHSLGLRMVAEGVEDRATRDELHRFGCDEIQGFYLTAALPAEVVVAWLDQRPAVLGGPARKTA
jgi:diguanylate cyclase (GGDEF)-like protein